MNQQKLSWIITITMVIIAFVALGIFTYGKLNQNNQTPTQTPIVTSNEVNYYCKEGIIRATYITTENATSTVSLTLKDGSKITLPQTVSASGIRYEDNSNIFISKGDNAILTQNNIDTYTNCISGNVEPDQTTATTTSINTFTNTAETFSFSFPNEFIISGGEMGYTVNWAQQSTSTGMILAQILIPKEFMPKTNFSDTKFTIGTSTDENAITNCLKYNIGNQVTTTSVMINGKDFTRITFADAGAGNFYETTSYRILFNNQCYAIEYTIHSTNIGNYSPDQGITEFDKTKILGILEGIVTSFKFL